MSRSCVIMNTVKACSRDSVLISLTKAREIRIEACSRFVQHQKLGVERHGARKRDALGHPARKLGRHLGRMLRFDLDQVQLEHHQVADDGFVEIFQFPQRQGHVLENAQCGKQRAILEQRAEAPLHPQPVGTGGTKRIHTEQAYMAPCRRVQPDDYAQQRGLAAPGAAHHADDFAASNPQVQVAMDRQLAAPGPQVFDFYERIRIRHGKPILLNIIANTASSRITIVIAATTAFVIELDTLSVFGLTRSP